MAIFKLWSSDRVKRRMIMCDSLQKLKAVGKTKLALEGDVLEIVLEEDGTVIDEDELLLACAGQTLMALCAGECWSQDPGNTPVPNLSGTMDYTNPPLEGRGTTLPPSPVPSPSSPSPSPCPSPLLSSSPSPVPYLKSVELPLPEFSLYVKHCLRNKQSAQVWTKAVEESAHYYLQFYPESVDNQKSYRTIGLKMYKAYPDISREGEHPWSTFTGALSQKLRALRLARKRKSEDCLELTGPSDEFNKLQRFKAPKSKPKPYLDLQTEEDYRRHVNEIQNESAKDTQNHKHLFMLLRESFGNRRNWIRELQGGTIQPVLEKFPCFRYGRYIWHEFKLILQNELNLDHKECTDNLELTLKKLVTMAPKKELNDGFLMLPSLLKYLDKETGYSRGKGGKSKSFLSVHHDIDDKDFEKLSTSDAEDGPRLILFIQGNETLESSIIATDNCRLECQSATSEQSLLILLAAYYVFNLSYPRKYANALGFLQQFVIKDVYCGEKSSKYKHFVRKYSEISV